jgi:hypothetical protein
MFRQVSFSVDGRFSADVENPVLNEKPALNGRFGLIEWLTASYYKFLI